MASDGREIQSALFSVPIGLMTIRQRIGERPPERLVYSRKDAAGKAIPN
jgi:hypothetical protein